MYKESSLYTIPVYNLRGVVLIPNHGNSVESFKDISGKRIATPKKDYSIKFLSRRFKDIDFNFTKDIEEAIKLLEERKVDAVVGDEAVIGYFLKTLKLRDEMQILDSYLYEEKVILVVPKDKEILVKILNKTILGIKKKKLMKKI